MFQFTTTNVINKNKDLTTGKPLFTPSTTEDSFNVKRVNNFKADNIVKVTHAPYMAPRTSLASIDLTEVGGVKGDAYRLSIYIRLDQSCQSSYYSNDMVFKGKPLSVEFNWNSDDVSKVAQNIEKIFRKYGIAVYEKPLVTVTAEGTDLVIRATDQYQRFHSVKIEHFEPKKYHGMGDFTTVVEALPAMVGDGKGNYVDNPELDGGNSVIVNGVEGFGTYEWLLHNLRLPTTARTRIYAMNSDETPIPGAHYDEFVIHYCVNRGILGTNAVGDLVKSMTTHVFYVNHDVLEEFKSALETVLGNATNPIEIEPVIPAYLKTNEAEKVEDEVDHGDLDTAGE